MSKFFTIAFLVLLAAAPLSAHAGKAELEKHYKPVSAKDLRTYLPPRSNAGESALGANSGDLLYTSEQEGCPDDIYIGSIAEDTPIFGGVDVNVYVDGDISINCGGL